MKDSDRLMEKFKDKPELMQKVEAIRKSAQKHGLTELEAFRRVADYINQNAQARPDWITPQE